MSKTGFAKDQLKSFINRIERLEEEKKATSDDIREVYAEAKGNGFDAKPVELEMTARGFEPPRLEVAELAYEGGAALQPAPTSTAAPTRSSRERRNPMMLFTLGRRL